MSAHPPLSDAFFLCLVFLSLAAVPAVGVAVQATLG